MRHVVRQSVLFGCLLRLYPPRFRKRFGAEMLVVSEESVRERYRRGWSASVALFLAELLGFLKGAAIEWRAKWTSRDYLAVSQTSQTSEAALPAEVREPEQQLELTLRQMVHAIAHHKFQEARSLSNAEREARENLQTLRQRYNLQDAPAA